MKQKSSVRKSLSSFTERKTISMGIKMKKGTGPGSVTLAGTKLIAYKTDGIMNSSNTYAIGWKMYYKSQKIYHPGAYKMEAVFNSTNGTPKIWNLNYTFNLTEENFE